MTQNGLYWVTVTDDHGCTDQDSVYVDSETSDDEIAFNPDGINIFPNPVQEILNVMVEMDTDKEVVLEMYTVLNTLVYKEDLLRTKLVRSEIDVNDFAPGSYIMRIIIDEIPYTYMVVVE
mgnify:CR=1 FL=1